MSIVCKCDFIFLDFFFGSGKWCFFWHFSSGVCVYLIGFMDIQVFVWILLSLFFGLGAVCIQLNSRLHFLLLRFLFFFFLAAYVGFSSMNSTQMYCSWIHKLYFSSTFSLKMGLTTLFAHLKIILLQCFQFSVSTK